MIASTTTMPSTRTKPNSDSTLTETFEPGHERNTETSIVGSTSNRAYWSVSSNPYTTVATSPSRSRLPSARVQQHQVLELRSRVRLPDRPQQDLAPLRPHRPARQVQRRAAHRVRHLVSASST